MDRLVNKMRLHKINVPVVYQCAVLQTWLKKQGIESEVVQGYVTIMNTGSCRHYWVETPDGTQYDIATAIGARFAPELTKYAMKLVRDPGNVKRFDEDEKSQKIVKENESLYELYVSEPKKFWTEKPKDLNKLKF